MNDNGEWKKDVKHKVHPAGRLAKALAWVIAPCRRLLAGSALVAASIAVAQAQDTAPAHWIAYAQLTGNELQARLSEGAGDLVTRLHGWMHKRQDAQGRSYPVIVEIWISPLGWVEQVEFDSLGDKQADADLRAILSAHPLPEPPPPDMRQPLVLQLTLQSNPDYGLDTSSDAER